VRAGKRNNEKKMAKFFEKVEPIDIIAFLVIVGGLILVGSHINGLVGSLLTAVVFYYFGKKGRAPNNTNVQN